MSAAVQPRAGFDQTDLPTITRAAVKLGLLEAGLVLLMSLILRYLEGPAETAAGATVLAVGLAAVTALPGRWTRARTIEGIAGAAGIGLGAAVVFLVVDLALLQPLGIYSHRWTAIGGGSNWWYHPVWWMVGTYLPWFGAWIFANQTARRGAPSLPGLLGLAFGLTIVCAVAGILGRFPGAGWNLGTFGVAFLPGLALATLVSMIGSPRS